MSTVGIIAEYNPFHMGHKYHIEKAKEITGCDSCVVIMSGNFVQRGEPAIYNKYDRAKMALNCGADLVIELPTVYATSSANFFALGAVSLLDSLGIVDYLVFGSELGNIDKLTECAKALANETDAFKIYYKEATQKGFNNAKARLYALEKSGIDVDYIQSNDILGIEYIKALIQLNSNIKPLCIKRVGADYNDSSLQSISSALAIRNELNRQEKSIIPLLNQIPEDNHIIIEKLMPTFLQDIWPFLLQKLNESLNYDIDLTTFLDVNRETAGKIKRFLYESEDLDTFLDNIATKETTLGHEKRSLIHILLNMKQSDFNIIIENGINLYIKVLGFKQTGTSLLNGIKRCSNLPLITNPIDGENIISDFYNDFGQEEKNSVALKMYHNELYVSDVYRIIQTSAHGRSYKHEFQEKIAMLH